VERRTDDQRQPGQTREELQFLAARKILHASAAALPLEAMLTTIANILIIAANASTAWLMLLDQGCLRTRAACGECGDHMAGSVCRDPGHPCYLSAVGTQPCVLLPHQIDPDDPVLGHFAGRECAVVLLPLRTDGSPVGAVGLAVSPEHMPDLSRLESLATQAAEAVQGAGRKMPISAWQQTLDTAFGQIAEPVLVFDREGRLVLWNAAAEEMLSHCQVAPGDSIATLLAKSGLTAGQGRPLRPEDCASARALRGERVDNLEEELPTGDGIVRHLLVSAAPLRSDGQIEGAVVVGRDVTHIRELERMRAEFLSAVSHQLRTPLTSVLGFAELLERKAGAGLSGEELKRGLRTIAEQARRINALVTDLIDGSQAEAGHLQLDLQPTDLTELIEDAVSLFRSREPGYVFSLDVRRPLPSVRADRGRIERVLRNLLSNAVKFSPPGTEIVLRAIADPAWVTVSVLDHGFGIAREDIPAVFMPFYRTRQVGGRGIKGIGLGLFMARAIVEAHGGSMWVQSQVGEGSTFYFRLPVAHVC